MRAGPSPAIRSAAVGRTSQEEIHIDAIIALTMALDNAAEPERGQAARLALDALTPHVWSGRTGELGAEGGAH